MLITYVKHYLTDAGVLYFKHEWFPWVDSILQQQKGFVSIDYYADQEDVDCMNISLKFKDRSSFNDWIAVPIHDVVINALDPYRARNYWKVTQSTDELTDLSTLEWTTGLVTQ